ncbi:MAG: hypothetical protein WC688_02325 [Parachlamydiales bacterium]|jgi:hypothetical protein
MKAILKLLKTIFVLIALVLCIKGYNLFTDGFRIDKIYPKFNEKIQAFPLDEIDEVFNQNYKYLSKGCQTYVFESEDGNYVIKFIRYHRYQLPLWLQVINYNQSYKNKREFYKTKLLKDSLNSYQIANNHLKNETAAIYVHLEKTNFLNKKIQIADRLHRKYFIDLDNMGFVVQKKVCSFKNILNKYKKDEKELKILTRSFLYTTKDIYEKGFINDDYNCIKNSGFIDNKVIHSDLGSFLRKDKLNEKEIFEKEFMRYVRHFKKWAETNAPFLITYVDEEIKKMSDDL